MERSWLLLIAGMILASWCALLVRYGWITGFRRKEVRRDNVVIVRGREAQKYGVFLMVLGVVGLIADIFMMVLSLGWVQST